MEIGEIRINAAIAELKSVADKGIERSMNLAAELAVAQARIRELATEKLEWEKREAQKPRTTRKP